MSVCLLKYHSLILKNILQLRDLKERRDEYIWEDAQIRRAARDLRNKVQKTKENFKDEGWRIPRTLLNTIKSAQCRLFQPKIHPEERLDKWWALRRLHLDLLHLLGTWRKEKEEEQKTTNDALGDCY